MADTQRPDFSLIVRDNEQAAATALAEGDFVKAFLLVHALVEALLRLFLRIPSGRDETFSDLVKAYAAYLEKENYPFPTFLNELTLFNRRRNEIVHNLWRTGYSHTNKTTKPAAQGAVMVYGLLIEWLETFDPEITGIGFRYDKPV